MGQQTLLALDLSSKSSGWALKDLDTQELVDYGCITCSDKNGIIRIIKMRQQLIELLTKHDSIAHIIAEDIPLTNVNTNTYKLLTYTQFALIEAILTVTPHTNYNFIYPNSWRSKIGIKTGAHVKREKLKQADIQYVYNKYGITVNDDIADAIGIADSYFIQEKNKIDLLSGGAW